MYVDMKEWLEKIRFFYESRDCEVILIAEAGSRQWGYANADSDHDLVIVYKHKDPIKLLFGVKKYEINFPEGLSAFTYEWSDFIELALKPNINLLTYLLTVYSAQLTTNASGQKVLEIAEDERALVYHADDVYLYGLVSALYTKIFSSQAVLARLQQQAFGCVQSYWKKGNTKKDFIRMAYFTGLAFQFENLRFLLSKGKDCAMPAYWLIAPQLSPCRLDNETQKDLGVSLDYLDTVNQLVEQAAVMAYVTDTAQKRSEPMTLSEKKRFNQLYYLAKDHLPDFRFMPKTIPSVFIRDKVAIYKGAWSIDAIGDKLPFTVSRRI